jgi:SAM-dependent methyltransferase
MLDTQKKWNDIYQKQGVEMPKPADVLVENFHLLPNKGKALDLACGLGGNAFFLSTKGFKVDAWDISTIAINTINQQNTPSICAEVHDISTVSIPRNSYNVIAISRFLDRQSVPKIISALKPKGLLFYQTFIKDKDSAVGPNNPNFLLARNELLDLFSALSPLVYREEASVGDTKIGFRNEAMLVAQKI